MAILATTEIHGDIIIDGAIISKASQQIYPSIESYLEAKNEMQNGSEGSGGTSQPTQATTTGLAYDRNIFCELPNGGPDLVVQAKQNLNLFGYAGVSISSKIQNKAENQKLNGTEDKTGKIILEAEEVIFKKPNQKENLTYRIDHLSVEAADKLNGERNIIFSDGFLTYTLNDILNQDNFSYKVTAIDAEEDISKISLNYLPITTTDTHYVINNVKKLKGLKFLNEGDAILELNNSQILSSSEGNTSFTAISGNMIIKADHGDLILGRNGGKVKINGNASTFIIGEQPLTTFFSNKVDKTLQINGHPLSANFNLTLYDLLKFLWGNGFTGNHGVPGFSYKKSGKTVKYTIDNPTWDQILKKICNGGGEIKKFFTALALGTAKVSYEGVRAKESDAKTAFANAIK